VDVRCIRGGLPGHVMGASSLCRVTTQFLAFFIYGADGKATWYAAQLANDGTGNYTLGGYRSRNAGA